MRIAKKLNMNREELIKNGPITIVAFGDSITHGIVGVESCNYEDVYWNRLKNKMLAKRSYVPVNVLCAGIGSTTAKGSIERVDKQVLSHHPDLVIVCFGLNDVARPIEEYLESLQEIFSKIQKAGCDLIFMTPNMLNTYVAEDTDPAYVEMAGRTSNYQNNGKMDLYIESACALAKNMGVKVCDCYSKWKKLSKICDTTMLLENRINHPKMEMHELFAESLFQMIMGEK